MFEIVLFFVNILFITILICSCVIIFIASLWLIRSIFREIKKLMKQDKKLVLNLH